MAAEGFRLAAVAIIALCAVLILKSYRPELAMQVSVAAGIAVLIYGLRLAGSIVDAANGMLSKYGLDPAGIKAVTKVIGIAYIAQFSADTCRDCGENSLAGKVELTGRLMMITAAIPLVVSTVEAIGGLMRP